MRRGRPIGEKGCLNVGNYMLKVLKPSKKRRCSIKNIQTLCCKCLLQTKNGGMRLAFKAFLPPKLSPAFPDNNARSKKKFDANSFSRKVFTPRVIECTGVVGFGGESMYRYGEKRGFQDHSGIPVSEARIQQCLWGKYM